MNDRSVTFHKLNPFTEFHKVKVIWEIMQNKCPHSFFLSWVWMESWLQTLPKNKNIKFIYGLVNDEPFVAYFSCIKKGIESNFVYCSRGYLNSTGNREQDEITIEYNGVLIDANIERDVRGLFTQSFSPWDEFICPAVELEWISDFVSSSNLNIEFLNKRPCYYVDLNKVRAHDNDISGVLSKNKRSQIKRSMKIYESNGPITLHVAETDEQAIEYLSELEMLHQKKWIENGKKGSFSSKFFKIFHIRLIKNNFTKNVINLVLIKNGDEAIGYLYNFIYQNKVLFYQNGFVYKNDNKLKPGLVCHYLAINYYAKKGYDVYDFLAGNDAYKKSLSTDFTELYWVSIRRNKFIFKIKKFMSKLRSKLV